jgi:hypothetical protein
MRLLDAVPVRVVLPQGRPVPEPDPRGGGAPCNRLTAGPRGRRCRPRGLACAFAGIPPATGRRRVTQRITLVGNDRRRDDDGAWKGLLDGLVKARVLVDDGPDWVETAPVEYDRGKRRKTAVTIEDAEPAEPAGSEG